MTIKNNLLKIRFTLGYKFAKDFAEYLNINQNQYAKYECQTIQPASKILLHMCKRLNKPIEEIIYEE